jgi:nucleotide-binding universal stress UspA family protein
MTVVAWLTEGTWEACVDATAELAPIDVEIALLYVLDPRIPEAARGAYAGLVGRGRRWADPGRVIETATEETAAVLLEAAAERLGRPCATITRRGTPEREVLVVVAATEATLLVLARDGDRRRLGPHTLAPETRFIVDHAPSRVLLVWPDEPPDLSTLPPPPAGHPPAKRAHPPPRPPPRPPDPPER